MKIILLTGSELRHSFFRTYVATHNSIRVLRTYCEGSENNLVTKVAKQEENNLRAAHLELRRQTEIDFFKPFCEKVSDHSNPIFIKKGSINDEQHVQDIIDLNPDVIVSYGCSIVKSRLLQVFDGRFINIHLGLSPYYRGSGTNYWPFVNNELQFVGVTFMYINEGIDTGEIIHQIRAEMNALDGIHTIGNRLIVQMSSEILRLLDNFDKLKTKKQLTSLQPEKVYKNSDFSEDSVVKLYENLSAKMISNYLKNKEVTDATFPIIVNSGIQ